MRACVRACVCVRARESPGVGVCLCMRVYTKQLVEDQKQNYRDVNKPSDISLYISFDCDNHSDTLSPTMTLRVSLLADFTSLMRMT